MNLTSFITYPKRGSAVNRNNLKKIVAGVKTRMAKEKDPFKKQAWAEIGIEINRLLLELD